MQQVLFRIPFPGLPAGIPIYGFGAMLFLAFVLGTWLAGRRAQKEGVRKEYIQDLAMWLLVGGIIGARLSSVLLEAWKARQFNFNLIGQFFRIWDGGLILYGSIIGGLLAYILAYRFIIRKHGLSTWKLADIVAPSLAVGVGLGRLGCFLNGCCYGGVACQEPAWQVHFPLSSPPRFALVAEGYQTAAGFTINERTPERAVVAAVEPGSAAAASGLKAGDVIVGLRDFPLSGEKHAINTLGDLENAFGPEWPRGKNALALSVQRGAEPPLDLPIFAPKTLGLHPTQLYESISMLLIFVLLSAYWPLRRHNGEVIALLMFCYGIHRSLNELLREDARPVAFEKYISVFLIVAGLALWILLRRLPVRPGKVEAVAAGAAAV
jgi:phosphatidylglycerol:prolipoprotein diacylglycerol transferase